MSSRWWVPCPARLCCQAARLGLLASIPHSFVAELRVCVD